MWITTGSETVKQRLGRAHYQRDGRTEGSIPQHGAGATHVGTVAIALAMFALPLRSWSSSSLMSSTTASGRWSIVRFSVPLSLGEPPAFSGRHRGRMDGGASRRALRPETAPARSEQSRSVSNVTLLLARTELVHVRPMRSCLGIVAAITCPESVERYKVRAVRNRGLWRGELRCGGSPTVNLRMLCRNIPRIGPPL